jgi:probable rRNA maturation factor
MIISELNQTLLKGGQRLPKKRLQEALAACTRVLHVKEKIPISIGFISEKQIRALNKAWRQKDRITDVLSFELNEEFLKGEVLLNYEQAKRQALALKHSTRDEVCFLIVHGVLHLFGHDHEKKQDAQRMFALQTKILESLGIDSRI